MSTVRERRGDASKTLAPSVHTFEPGDAAVFDGMAGRASATKAI
jgi:hypothetical protein